MMCSKDYYTSLGYYSIVKRNNTISQFACSADVMVSMVASVILLSLVLPPILMFIAFFLGCYHFCLVQVHLRRFLFQRRLLSRHIPFNLLVGRSHRQPCRRRYQPCAPPSSTFPNTFPSRSVNRLSVPSICQILFLVSVAATVFFFSWTASTDHIWFWLVIVAYFPNRLSFALTRSIYYCPVFLFLFTFEFQILFSNKIFTPFFYTAKCFNKSLSNSSLL